MSVLERASGRAPEDTIPALLGLIADRPAVVFWQCSAGADALYEHLRGINLVMIPKEFLPDAEISPLSAEELSDQVYDLVLFRHADANVMSQLAAAMQKNEIARFLGPAQMVIFLPDITWRKDIDRFTTINQIGSRPSRLGPLKLSKTTMERMIACRLTNAETEISAYLRRVPPANFQTLSDPELRHIVLISQSS